MINFNDLHPEYITDQTGEKKSIIFPIAEFEELLEDMEDLVTIAERKEEATLSQDDLVKELKQDGFLSD